MYADDTVLFASTKNDLQKLLDTYDKYCKKWKLDINVSKTKVLCFGRKVKHVFMLNGEQLEQVESFKYLGVVFSRNGRFTNAIKENLENARKAMFTLRNIGEEAAVLALAEG